MALAVVLGAAWPSAGVAADQGAVERGAYLFHAAGCQGCHTDAKNGGPPLAGGPAIKTPFGTFYGPNITPDAEHGIGGWSDADFIRALRQGVAPDGSDYYPVFPYTSFTRIRDRDLLDIKAYIFAQPPSDRASRPHEVDFPFRWRFLLGFWKWLNFEPGVMAASVGGDEQLARGAYLVKALAHCGECHTPRDWLGGLDRERALAGAAEGPDGKSIPNITPDPETGIGEWSVDDIMWLLRAGILPDGDTVGSLMGEVVRITTSKLTEADQRAIAAYLRSLPPVRHKVGKGP